MESYIKKSIFLIDTVAVSSNFFFF